MRLISAAEPRYARTVVIATTTPEGFARLPSGIRQRAAVRIELMPWSEDDVTGFLARSIRRVGGDEEIFSTDAAATLARFAGGVPRVVSQLAQLALVAAAGDGLTKVDAATVERTWRELAPSCGLAAAAVERPVLQVDDDEADAVPAVNPHVRVVRRLWG